MRQEVEDREQGGGALTASRRGCSWEQLHSPGNEKARWSFGPKQLVSLWPPPNSMADSPLAAKSPSGRVAWGLTVAILHHIPRRFPHISGVDHANQWPNRPSAGRASPHSLHEHDLYHSAIRSHKAMHEMPIAPPPTDPRASVAPPGPEATGHAKGTASRASIRPPRRPAGRGWCGGVKNSYIYRVSGPLERRRPPLSLSAQHYW